MVEKRQGNLLLKQGDNTANARMDTVDADTIGHYDNLLETTLRESKLSNLSALIYNVGIPLDPKAQNVVAKTGTKKVRFYREERLNYSCCVCKCCRLSVTTHCVA